MFSLDQCADQYVVALSPRSDIVGLSTRATRSDSFLAATAKGLPQRRATSEAILGADPQVVVRYWGGDPRLAADLERRGVRVVDIDDAKDFAGVRDNVRRVAAALEAPDAGKVLIARMDSRLAASGGAWRGRGALYLTSGGFTAGRGTLIDAMLRAAGLANLAGRPGFHFVSLETLVMSPPEALVEGFFDASLDAFQRWSEMRNPLVSKLTAGKTVVSLPASMLGCPAWFAADGAAALAARASAP